MNIPEFTPIETRYPEWWDARQLVKKLTPSRLRFVVTSYTENKVALDYQFVHTIIESAPFGYRDELIKHMNEVISTVASAIPSNRFEQYIFNPMNDRTLEMMNATLQFIDNERVYEGKSTTIQIMNHTLGIERCICTKI